MKSLFKFIGFSMITLTIIQGIFFFRITGDCFASALESTGQGFQGCISYLTGDIDQELYDATVKAFGNKGKADAQKIKDVINDYIKDMEESLQKAISSSEPVIILDNDFVSQELEKESKKGLQRGLDIINH